MLTIVILILLTFVFYNWWYHRKVYWFYSPGCPHCSNMRHEWDNFKIKCMLTTIQPIEIDTTDPENELISNDFGVQGVPHIVKLVNGERIIFDGNRTSEELLSWANN